MTRRSCSGPWAAGCGCLGSALDSYLSLEAHPRSYGELYVPTVLHHLGHRLVDIDAFSDLYTARALGARVRPRRGLRL